MAEPAPLPRYLEIQRDLQNLIASGEWGPGARVPSELELQAHYQCARMTVNKALSALANAGLIVRKRKSGSFVASPKSQQMVLQINDIQAEISALGKAYRFEILKRTRRKMTIEDMAHLGVEEHGFVLALSIVHFADDQPYVYENRLINLAIIPSAEAEPFAAAPPGSWLLNLVPWTEAEHVISACVAENAMAQRLGIQRGDACLVIERRTWQGGATITWVRLTYPAERHTLTSRFSPADPLGYQD
eukprot:gene14097-14216_t